MGVNDLWPILEPVKKHVHLQSLSGKTLAVDLSLWVCESQTVKKMIGTVTKPHLRNLFFRISSLTLMDVKLVFVMEGDAPKLKTEAMSKRNEVRYGPTKKPQAANTGRLRFKSVLKECLEMLECLGIPWVQAAGEAEAMCAYLNANRYVDGCLTNDGDAFLYGAQTVYRNFTMNIKDPHVDCYTMSSIKEELGLDRDALIGLAILLGCDYLPKGVPGVGKEQALKLIGTLKGQSLLQRFDQWKEQLSYCDTQAPVVKKVAHCSVCAHPGSPKEHEQNGCKFCRSDRYCEPHDYDYCCPCDWHRAERSKHQNGIESIIKKKAWSCEGFPFHEVIQEFLFDKDRLVKIRKYQRPDLLSFQRFASEKMEWPKHYACEKLLVLLTHYDMIERKVGRKNPSQLQARRIIKTRIRNGIRCFEIEWQKPEFYAAVGDEPMESAVVTVEEESLFQDAYPEIVAIFQKQKLEDGGNKQKKQKRKPKEKDLLEADDSISDLLSHMSLKPTRETLPVKDSKSNRGIPLDNKSTQGRTRERKTLVAAQEPSISSPPIPASSQHESVYSHSVFLQATAPRATSPHSSVIASLQLDDIDWEGTSFSASPAVQAQPLSTCCSKSELEASLPNPKSHPRQLQCKSRKDSPKGNTVAFARDLSTKSSGEHLASGAGPRDTQLRDLPLKERIFAKVISQPMSSSHQAILQPKQTESKAPLEQNQMTTEERHPISPSLVDDRSHASDRLRISSQNNWGKSTIPNIQRSLAGKTSESFGHRASESLGLECKSQSVFPETFEDSSAFYRDEKTDVQNGQNQKTKRSVCLDRYSSDEESNPQNIEAQYAVYITKQFRKQRNPTQFKTVDTNKLRGCTLRLTESEQPVQAFKEAGGNVAVENPASKAPNHTFRLSTGEKSGFPTVAQRFQSVEVDTTLPHEKKQDESVVCLDSPLPLSQRIKLRLQQS
ncbi:flap endonuclease GEN homolog 1 [Tachyglossus aculeatus]|uniref:flap endonuclease GEN homolog 1 n=1 Tax=Tachyglossus aculeatus TaxID=9261 RepID=UPI0018F7AB00|nr:flap endonuclease GEN homolog 1 [Tachyglossus aculeatus]